MEQIAREPMVEQRMVMALMVSFAGLALVLSSLGIYSVLSYSMAQRTREIGMRMALGAQRGDVLGLVTRLGLKLTGIGVGIGIVLAFALTKLISSLLYGVKPSDPLTYAAVSIGLGLVAMLACLIPAKRATKVDPMEALRYE